VDVGQKHGSNTGDVTIFFRQVGRPCKGFFPSWPIPLSF
jgi:hypothetical protein